MGLNKQIKIDTFLGLRDAAVYKNYNIFFDNYFWTYSNLFLSLRQRYH